MYEMPNLYQAKNYLVKIPNFALEALSSECTILKYSCDEDFYTLCNILMLENGLSHKDNPYDAVNLYTQLRHMLQDILLE